MCLQRLFDEFNAAVGDYLSVGPVLLQLLPLPLLRYPKRKKKSHQQPVAEDLWDVLKTDGLSYAKACLRLEAAANPRMKRDTAL